MPQHAIAILFGTLLAFYGNELPDPFWLACLPILLLLCFLHPGYRFVGLMAAAYIWSCAVFHQQLEYRLVAEYDNRITLLQAVIADLPELRQGRIRLVLEPVRIDGYPKALPRIIRLNWYQHQQLPKAGELWQFEVKLKQPGGFVNPAGFDYAAWQFVKGIDASGYIRQSELNRRLTAAPWWRIDRWRHRIASAIDQYCRDCAYRGLIKALSIGYRGDISDSQQALLKDSGTAHLLAISGLHIAMVSLLFFTIGRCCWVLGLYRTGANRMETASIFAITAAMAYAALAGFSLPTVRALVMLSIVFAGLLLRRRINLLQCISLAVIIILIVDPVAVGSVSFWLSISALLVIAFAQFRMLDQSRWWQQLLALQLYFSVLFAPIGLLIFEQITPASYLANLIAIPLVSFVILPLTLIATVFSLIAGFAAEWLFAVVNLLISALMEYLELLIDSGLASISSATIPLPLLLLILLALLLWLMPRGMVGRRLALLMLVLPLAWQTPRPGYAEYQVTVFDVGMGTSVFVQTQQHSLVYDFGPGNASGFSAADWALIPYMKQLGIVSPDLMIISHVDQDHSGGFQSFLESYQPSRLLSGTAEELKLRFNLDHAVGNCHQYPDWRWDGVSFRFLSATSTVTSGSTNNRSCILQIDGFHRILIPGDIEAKQEMKLVDLGAIGPVDVLLAPHHGSSTSSSPEFIERVHPQHVIFTVSRANRWGFPKPTVISRYRALESIQYRTDLDGAISLHSTYPDLQVHAFAKPNRRIWR